MARRGFLAELNRQMKRAEADRNRRERAAERERTAAIRMEEQARKADERAAGQLAKASAARKKQFEKEYKQAHIAAMESEVARLNLELEQIYEDLDGLLAATLNVDDYVDLEGLRATVDHPPFDRPELTNPTAAPQLPDDPPKPDLNLPGEPTGMSRLLDFGRHQKAVEEARASHERTLKHWEAACRGAQTERDRIVAEHAAREERRLEELAAAREQYQADCTAREAQVAQQNAKLDELISNLGYGVAGAVQEYVEIVLANSLYPDHFSVEYTFNFEPSTAELALRALIPPPEALPAIKAYRYVKSKDEISESSVSKKVARDRYSGAAFQVALRTLHEVFEADRRHLIKTIALEVGTETTHPATGLHGFIPFVAVGAERETLVQFDLAGVVPSATLDHLGASLSKDPFGLVAADPKGVRKSE